MTTRNHDKSIKKTGLPEPAFPLSAQESSSIIECSPDCIVRYDPNGRIRFMNQKLLDLLELSANDVTGKLPVELWPDGRYAEIDKAAALALKTGETAIAEFCAPDLDGEIYFKQVYVVPEKDKAGQIIGTIAYGRSVSALREAENRLRHFIENIPGIAYTFRLSPDGHGSFPFISSGIVEFFGLNPEDVRHNMMPIHLLAHPDDRPRIEAAIAESARTMQPYSTEYRICRPGYPERWIDARSTPEQNSDGSILWHGIMLDITNKKQLEIQQVTHLHYYQSMDRVNRAMQGTNDLEKMMHDVLDVVLSIFDCDHTFIAAADNANWHIHMERSKPEYSGALALGMSIDVDEEITEQLRILKESPGPVQFGQNASYPLSHAMAERYQIKSQMMMTLQPKQVNTWHFGIHQCSHPRVWSRAEERLFQKIGQRLQDGLTSLLMYRNLSTSEQNFRSLAENIPDGIVRYNRQAQVIYANQELKRYIGNVADTILGTTPREHHPNGSFEDYAQVLDQVLASGKAGELEKTSIFPNRKKWTAHIKIVPERDENGLIVSALAIGHDITEQKRLEQQLKSHLYYLEQMDKINRAMQGSNDLEQVMHNVLDVVLAIFDCERAFLFYPDEINAVTPHTSMERIKPGYPGALTLGKTLPLDEELRSAHRIIMERSSPVQFGPDAECQVPRFLHDEYQVKSQILMVLHPKLGKPWFFGIHRCIKPALCSETEAQLFQEIGQRLQDTLTGLLMYRDLRASEQKFRSLAENLPDNIVRYDKQKKTIYINPLLEHTLGRSAPDILGTTPREFHPDGSYEDYASMLDSVLTSGKTCELEKRIEFPDGQKQVHQIRMVPELDENGDLVGALAIGRDITERKHMEMALTANLHHLENMDKINRAMQGGNDLEQMMSNVLDVVLKIFDCDRAFFQYPCDPEAAAWTIPMERTTPDYPGVLALGLSVPMEPDVARMMHIMLQANSPVKFGPESVHPVPASAANRFQIKSKLLTGLHPKLGKPWIFGIHQCTHPRIWSDSDVRLIHEIGLRLQDTLTSLLMYRDLSASEQKFRSLAENMPDNVVRYNRKGETIYVNPALERLLGMTEDELIGKTPRELSLLNANNEYYSQLIERVIASGNAEEVEMLLPAPNEEMRVHQIRIIPEFGKNGEVIGALGIGRDITQQKHEEEILCLAYHDTLTSLPNRRLLIDRLEHTMSASKRSRRYVALMFIDLDNFKPLNDQYGHDTGDQLLIEAAERISGCVRDADTVARFGGDEFVVLLSDLDTEKTSAIAQAELVAEKIRSMLSTPYLLELPREDSEVRVTVEHHCTSSIGVVVVINHEASVANVLKWADIAMYRAKEAGRNRVHFYHLEN